MEIFGVAVAQAERLGLSHTQFRFHASIVYRRQEGISNFSLGRLNRLKVDQCDQYVSIKIYLFQWYNY